MYFTRPTLRPLNLDLATLKGGGSCPAQFWGETDDGREIFIRYRGGWLSVTSGEQTLLEAGIGPGLHGELLLEQACDLTGLTIRGRKPPLSEAQRLAAAEESDILDWSGRTTYWLREFFPMTKGSGLSFVEAMQERFPGCVLLELDFSADYKRFMQRRKTLAACGRGDGMVVLGIEPDAGRLERLVASRDVKLAGVLAAFATVTWFTFRRDFGTPRLDLPYGDMPDDIFWKGILRMQYANGDQAARVRVQEIVALAERCFPALIPPAG